MVSDCLENTIQVCGRNMDDKKKNPNALTYGITPSAPASIKPVDIESWKAVVSPTFKHYFTERYNELVKQYETLVRDYEINQLLYESSMGFKPIIGKTYYLYTKNNGPAFISMIDPGEAFWDGYVGAFKFNAQYAWEEVL
jgi:hypothetical protein